jgi:hypothetical protein
LSLQAQKEANAEKVVTLFREVRLVSGESFEEWIDKTDRYYTPEFTKLVKSKIMKASQISSTNNPNNKTAHQTPLCLTALV